MTFFIELKISCPPNAARVAEYDSDNDSVLSIFLDLCDELEEAEGNTFEAGGFGVSRWPVDLGTDLPHLLEQLPEALSCIRRRSPFTLEFHGQGVEREVDVEFSDEGAVLTCRGAEMTGARVDRVDTGSLEALLVAVRDEFMSALERFYPRLVDHPWVVEWHQETLSDVD